jgi:methyl-accepting chemotaxis protein
MKHTEGLIEAITNTQAVVSFTPDGIITDANELFLKTMGYERDQVVGQHHRIFMETKAAERPEYTQFWVKLREGAKQEGDFRRINKSGNDVWLSATYTPISKDGKVTSIVKLGRDITKEKLRSVENDTQVAAINRTQAVVSFDVDGNILQANEIFLRAMGYSLAEVVGKHHRMFMPTPLPSDYSAFWKALGNGESKTGEFLRFAKGGREVYLQAVYTPIVLEGKVIKVIKFAQDVTKEKMRTMDFECQIEAIRATQVVLIMKRVVVVQ